MKKIISMSLVGIMILVTIISFGFDKNNVVEAAVTEKQLINEQRALQKNQEEIEKKLAKLETEKADVISTKAVLDEQMINTQDQIRLLDKAVTSLDKTLTEQEKELEKTKVNLNEYYDAYKERVRQSYEEGDSSYLSVVFGSGSFTEFFRKSEVYLQIVEYDNQLMEKLTDSINKVETLTTSISDKKEDNVYAKQQAEIQNVNYQKQVEKSNGLISSLELDKDKYIALEKEADAALDVLSDQIAQIARDNANAADKASSDKALSDAISKAESDAATSSSKPSSSSGSSTSSSSKPSSSSSKPDAPNPPEETSEYYYPVIGYFKITSPFGMRRDPFTGLQKMHKGVDIGGYANGNHIAGEDVHATKSGKIIFSAWDKWGGNMISIDHGNSLVSTYMHMTTRLYSVGDIVTKGQVIGYVGTTGNSTGPHLHFELMRNGVVFNPLTLFPNIKFTIA